MERRAALAAACASGVCLAVGTVSFAAIGGVSILGYGGGGAPRSAPAEPTVVRRVQTVDDVVVVVSTAAPSLADPSVEAEPSQGIVGAPIALAKGSGSGPAALKSPVPVTTGDPAPVGAAGAAGQPAVTTPTTLPPDGPATGTTTPQPTGTVPPPTQPAAQPASTPSASSNPPTTQATVPAGAPPASAPPSSTAPSSPPATTAPPPASAPPTTVRPPGVPANWPASRPIPPMPPNCQKPQLEDNGVWNCDH
jgi:hypothetical protein